MSVFFDNLFSKDNNATRTERLLTIQQNLASIQSELNAPAHIVTWAATCYDAYSAALLPLEVIKENTNIELTYILANSIGTEIERTTASSGEIVNFKTHNLSSGAYFIKVEANTNTLNPLSKSKSIIISR